jgi:hypothetical protein
MPDWVADKKRRAEKIRNAKAELEAEAKAAAEAKLKAEAEAAEKREAEGRRKPGPKAAPPSTEPYAKAQKNFTDPDSRIMTSKDGSCRPTTPRPMSMERRRLSWRTT